MDWFAIFAVAIASDSPERRELDNKKPPSEDGSEVIHSQKTN